MRPNGYFILRKGFPNMAKNVNYTREATKENKKYIKELSVLGLDSCGSPVHLDLVPMMHLDHIQDGG